jgi:ABC-2 type transport system permease protein
MTDMGLYFRYAMIALRGQLRYRGSFFLTLLGQFMVPFIVFAGILSLFARFGNLRGWTLPEALLCFAVVQVSFALTEIFARGFDAFSSVLSNGEFDRILVRPRNPVLQVLGARFDFARVGKVFLAVAALVWSISALRLEWDVLKGITLVLMIASGISIFTGIFIAGASLCFWTTDGLEVVNIFTDGGREMAQYPLSIYPDWARKFFTFVIPFGCVNYLPLTYVLGRPGATPAFALLPLVGFLFVIPCALIWNRGMRRYRSVGS